MHCSTSFCRSRLVINGPNDIRVPFAIKSLRKFELVEVKKNTDKSLLPTKQQL